MPSALYHACKVVQAVLRGACSLRPDVQARLMDLLIQDPILTAIPPHHQYLTRLYKRLIDTIESQGHELDEGLVEQYTHCLVRPKEV